MEDRKRFNRIVINLICAGMPPSQAITAAKDIFRKEQRSWEKLMAEEGE